MRELAARRVHQGVSLEVFIHAYRVALLAYWDACADEATRLRISREAGFALARSAIDAIDTITTQAAEAYLREETRFGRRAVARPETWSSASSTASRSIPAGATPPPPGWTRPDSSSPSSEGSSRQRSRSATPSNSPGTRSRRACRSGPSAPRDDPPRRARPNLGRNLAARQNRKPARGTPTNHRRTQHRRPLRRQRPVARLRERTAGLPRSSTVAVLHLAEPADRLARRPLGTRMRTDRRDRHHQGRNRLQGQQPAGALRRRSRRGRRNDPRLLRRRPQRRQSRPTDARPPQHRALPTPADRHQDRSRPSHLHRPRRPALHPRGHWQRRTARKPGLRLRAAGSIWTAGQA